LNIAMLVSWSCGERQHHCVLSSQAPDAKAALAALSLVAHSWPMALVEKARFIPSTRSCFESARAHVGATRHG
jgi:hypothetical protein